MAAKLDVEYNGEPLTTLYPERQKHRSHDTVSEVAIRQTPKEDLYAILVNFDATRRAQIKVLVIPLVAWIWIGGIVMIVGTLIALGPDRLSKKSSQLPVLKSAPQQQEVEYAS